MFFVSTGVSNGEFPEILIAKCRSIFFCTWIFSRTEDFESWQEGRKGPSKSGEECSRRKVCRFTVLPCFVSIYVLNQQNNDNCMRSLFCFVLMVQNNAMFYYSINWTTLVIRLPFWINIVGVANILPPTWLDNHPAFLILLLILCF